MKIPGPPESMLVQTYRYFADPEGYLRKLAAKYGDIFEIETIVFGKEVCVVRPAEIKQIFTSDPDELRAGEANTVLEPVLGKKSVLLLDGAEHLRQRRLVLPPFHGERMLAYVATMREITERVVDEWPLDEPISLHPHMQHVALEIVLRTVFGVQRGPELDGLARAIDKLLRLVGTPVAMIATHPAVRKEMWGLSPWAHFQRVKKRVDDRIYEVIARRREERARGAASGTDVLSMLLDARDEAGNAMTDVELRDELITLLVAGHETTATEICWAFDKILRDARVQGKLRDEIDASPDLAHAPYLDATIKEVLRMSPVVPAVGRRVRAPMKVGGYDVPVGSLLVPVLWITHHLPDLYPKPDSFEPERFLGKKPDPYEWLPFGGGVRRCVGMAFALTEMKIVIGTILRRVELRLADPREARTVLRGFTHAPKGGTRVVVERRRATENRGRAASLSACASSAA